MQTQERQSLLSNKSMSMNMMIPLLVGIALALFHALSTILPKPFLVSFAVFFSFSLSCIKRRKIAQKFIVAMVAMHLVTSVVCSPSLKKVRTQLISPEHWILENPGVMLPGENLAFHSLHNLAPDANHLIKQGW
jgi:predicted neutral ceramidase superfamily lipid hydrolase